MSQKKEKKEKKVKNKEMISEDIVWQLKLVVL